MKSHLPRRLGLAGGAAALLVAACVGAPPAERTVGGAAPGYQLMLVASPTPIPIPVCTTPKRVAVKSVQASSIRSKTTPYFQPTNTIDGIVTSAWGADWDDKNPWLRYVFDCAWLVKDVDIKLSLRGPSGTWNERVLVDVYMAERETDTTLKLVGKGLRPKETILYKLDLPDTVASKSKLFFRLAPGSYGNISDLLVCEVAFNGCRTVACPTPAPTPTPTTRPSPTPTPTPTPSVRPSPTPTPTGIPSTIPD